MPSRLLCVLCLVALSTAAAPIRPDEAPEVRVGVQPDGSIVVPTNQVLRPAGKQVSFPGRPVDLALLDDGRTLVVKNMKGLVFLDSATGAIKQTLASPTGFSVVGLLAEGPRVYVTDTDNHVRIAVRGPDGAYAWGKPLLLEKPEIGGVAHPAGLARLAPGRLLVCSTRGNSVQLLDEPTGKVVQTVPVGVAPFAVLPVGPSRCYVSNWGGDRPGKDDPTGVSSGSAVRIDPRTHVADHGSVSVLQQRRDRWETVKSVRVGGHPSALAASPGGDFVYVANANSDTVSVISTATDAVVETIRCRPEARLPFGSGCNALALSRDGDTLYVANGTNNCVAVVRLGSKACAAKAAPKAAASELLGLIPTGWYPGAVLLAPDGKRLFVANLKGHGSLAERRPAEKGKNSHDHLGTVSLLELPDREGLAKHTETVHRNNRLAYSLAGLERPRPDARPVPIPQRHGEPSPIQHVIYIIKENRTYDQVFGDMKEGNGAPNLVLFGEDVTPNHHKLAREFTLFDNFYCSGVLSADGHSWINEAYVTDYLERSFGRFARSYPYEGSDALAFATSGFLWDNALAHKKTFRNYGEFIKSTYEPAAATWSDLYNDFTRGTRQVKITATPNLKSLAAYSHPSYPGFPLKTPDVYRAGLFLEELKKYEERGEFPNLVYLFLPCDHTSGTNPGYPTPRAMVADNDLALGRVVEAVSKSRFWKETALFVVEDDPQAGFDHVDGHRTVALVISPYTKRKFVDHTCYNQTGMVKTIELILGLPPMTQLDLSATAMRACFQEKPDFTPYTCLPNKVPLDQMNPPLKDLKGTARHWAEKSLTLDFDEADEADEDTLNRILWHSVHGDRPYPAAFTNAGRK